MIYSLLPYGRAMAEEYQWLPGVLSRGAEHRHPRFGDEIRGAAVIALMEAVACYGGPRDRFGPFAKVVICRRVVNAIRAAYGPSRDGLRVVAWPGLDFAAMTGPPGPSDLPLLLRSLPAVADRRLLCLVYRDGLTGKEAARVMGYSESNVSLRLAASLDRLRADPRLREIHANG